MEINYTFTFKNGRILYRGIKEQYADPKYSKISWFSEKAKTAEKYTMQNNRKIGEIFTYKTTKELKLININSMFFKVHFIDKINMFYRNEAYSEDKIRLFSTLGIPDLGSVNYVINKYFTEKPKYMCHDPMSEDTQKIKLFANYLGGHRLSEYTMDAFFAEKLKELYGHEFDGYISPIDWSSCFHGALPAEICLFRPFRSVKLIGKYNPSKNVKKGGKKDGDDWTPPWDSHNYVDNETIEDYNKRKLIELRRIGYLRKIKYDEEGRLVWPLYDELIDGINDNLFERGDPYEIAKRHGYTFIPIEEWENEEKEKSIEKKKAKSKKN
jgi:hypothetical protein